MWGPAETTRALRRAKALGQNRAEASGPAPALPPALARPPQPARTPGTTTRAPRPWLLAGPSLGLCLLGLSIFLTELRAPGELPAHLSPSTLPCVSVSLPIGPSLISLLVSLSVSDPTFPFGCQISCSLGFPFPVSQSCPHVCLFTSALTSLMIPSPPVSASPFLTPSPHLPLPGPPCISCPCFCRSLFLVPLKSPKY